MKSILKGRQSGFTLIEIAIVLVIIGLLLAAVLQGQGMINSAKVKNLASDFRKVPVYIYGYLDRFKEIPGDDPRVVANVAGTLATSPAGVQGNSVINGLWNSTTNTDESFLFWQHARLAGFAAGSTDTANPAYIPRNADSGIMGIQSNVGFVTITAPTAMTGTYIICSDGILGKYVRQLDITLDDGETSTGSVRAVLQSAPGIAVLSDAVEEANSYTVCMGV
ncbi:MAG: type II secretion system protein [Nitrosomonadales bacterium]|jgi:prepilin-type N-terminal cleavage/methylation domain-containing protein|nr:MAG: type II secretion system protein [Nitrosomonadales bacterium]